jgi:hypothetical protein
MLRGSNGQREGYPWDVWGAIYDTIWMAVR